MRTQSAAPKIVPLAGIELQHGRWRVRQFAPHFHEEFQILVMLDGELRLTVSGQTRSVTAPAICVVNPWQVHAGIAKGWGWESRNFYVTPTAARQLTEGDAPTLDVFSSPFIEDANLARRLAQAHEAALKGEGAEAVGAALKALFLGFATKATPSSDAGAHPGIRRALAHLHAKFVEPATIEALAEIAGLSRFHFLRTFARATGMTPHAYQNQLRLAQAKRRLREDAPAARAATESGFCDQSHLIRVFRRSHGMTPAAIRRSSHRRNFVQ